MGCGSPCSSWGGGGGGLRLAKPSAKTWRKGYPALFARFFAGGYGVWGVSPAPQNPLSGRYTLRMPLAWLTGGAGRGAKPLGGARSAPPRGFAPSGLGARPDPPTPYPPGWNETGVQGAPSPLPANPRRAWKGPRQGTRGAPLPLGRHFSGAASSGCGVRGGPGPCPGCGVGAPHPRRGLALDRVAHPVDWLAPRPPRVWRVWR